MPVAIDEEKEVTYYITPVGRLSYLNVWKPRKQQAGNEDKIVYDCSLIMDNPKEMTVDDQQRYKQLKKLIADKKLEKWPKLTGKVQCKLRTVKGYEDDLFFSKPLDGDKNPEYLGKIVLGAVSYGQKPQVLRADKQEMMDPSELYSGCYGRLWVTAFAYDNAGNKGVSFSLQGVMKVRDGKPLGGTGGSITKAFESVEVETDGFETTDDEDLEEF